MTFFLVLAIALPAAAMTPTVSMTTEDPQGTTDVHQQASGSALPVQVPARAQTFGATFPMVGNFQAGFLHRDSVAIVGGNRFTMRTNAVSILQGFNNDRVGLTMNFGWAQAYGAAMATLKSAWVAEPGIVVYALANGMVGVSLSRELVITNGGYAWTTLIGLRIRGPEMFRSSSKSKK
ncbi:MAG: hypothetical protein AAB152_11245 [Candidatus Coatesbacteria bacterium]